MFFGYSDLSQKYGASSKVFLNCDQAAAMPPGEEVLAFYLEACRIAGSNQESLHKEAREIRKAMESAGKEMVSDLTGGEDFTVVWSDSGTGIFNLLFNTGFLKGRRIVTSHLEHPALTAMLKASGSSLEFRPCDRRGIIAPPEGDFDFAAFTAVQSELGVLQDPKALFGSLPPQCIRFADAVQMAGKMPLGEWSSAADLIAVSGIKFGSPGGAALLVRKSAPWSKAFLESAARSRHPLYTAPRVFPPAALSCAWALQRRKETMEEDLQRMRALNAFLRQALKDEEIVFSVPEPSGSPYILHCFLPGKQGAVVVRQLSECNIMANSGSACAAESASGSPALRALGYGKKESFSGLRLSFGFDFSQTQAEFLAENLLSVLKNY